MGFNIEIRCDSMRYEVSAEQGEKLLAVLQRMQHLLAHAPTAICGGRGTCKKCRVVVTHAGHAGTRQIKLACMTTVEEGMVVELADESVLVISDSGAVSLAEEYPPDAMVRIRDAASCAGDAASEASDAAFGASDAAFEANDAASEARDSLSAALPTPRSGLSAAELAASQLRQSSLPKALRSASAPRNPESLASDAALFNTTPLGVAVDVGTTTVVARLINMLTGEKLGSVADINPQALYGADVLSRIDACMRGERETLTTMIRDCVVRLIRELTKGLHARVSAPVDLEDESPKGESSRNSKIASIAVTGNTIMEHIFAGLSPESIGVAPFTPLSLFGDELALEGLEELIGLEGLESPVWLAPAIAGYVGGDISCDLLALKALQTAEPFILIDLGTNGELAFFDGQRIHCCATAAGPVFEGGGVHFGMAALPGAISHVALVEDGTVELTTIGGLPARGLCGTGLISVVAALFDAGIVDETGLLRRQAPDQHFAHLIGCEMIDGTEQTVFYLTEDRRLFLTQKDVRSLQLAKAAVAAGIKTLLEDANKKLADIGCVTIAGGFGAALDISSAALVGLVPPEVIDRTQAVGNAAIEGISAALISSKARKDLLRIVKQCDYVELSTSAVFNRHFMECMSFERPIKQA